jgi:nucleotide-binding universal stress UspA family protein
VLATHGRTGIKRLVIGNVAEKVVRHAPCPVLTVKPNAVTRAQEAAACAP